MLCIIHYMYLKLNVLIFLPGTYVPDPSASLSDHLMLAVLQLLKKEVSEHGRHLQQYFHLFLMYANLGTQQVHVHPYVVGH